VLFPYPEGAATGWLLTGLTNVSISSAITWKQNFLFRMYETDLGEAATTVRAFVHPWSLLAARGPLAGRSRHSSSHIADTTPGHSWRPVARRAAGAGTDSGTWCRQWQPAKRMVGQRTDGNERPCTAESDSYCRARSGWDKSRRCEQWRTPNRTKAGPVLNLQGAVGSLAPGPQKHQTDLF
jgi:hypothetical protein